MRLSDMYIEIRNYEVSLYCPFYHFVRVTVGTAIMYACVYIIAPV